METIIASAITGVFGVIAVLITNAHINKRGYEKIDSKIGNMGDETLSGQHIGIKETLFSQHTGMKETLSNQHTGIKETLSNQHKNIKETLSEQHRGIKESLMQETLRIYSKVDKINDITIKNETLYENLNQDQKEVRNNVNKLIHDWEKTALENKELKEELNQLLFNFNILNQKNEVLESENKRLSSLLDKANKNKKSKNKDELER